MDLQDVDNPGYLQDEEETEMMPGGTIPQEAAEPPEDNAQNRLQQYLQAQVKGQQFRSDPGHLARVGDNEGRNADAADQRSLGALLMDSAAKFGTVNGKTPDSNSGAYAQQLNQNMASYQNRNDAMHKEGQSADAQQAKLYEYLANQQQKQGDAKIAQDNFNRQMKFKEDALKSKANQAPSESWRESSNVDENGNAMLYNPKTGQYKASGMKAKNPLNKDIAKTNQEVDYRVNSMKQSAQKLKGLISKHGTIDLGEPGTQMDSAIYQMAVDFAKVVDPGSVAREGEVAAAQKYMLPVRNLGGARYSNAEAQKIVDDYVKDLDSRVKALAMAQNGEKATYQTGAVAPSGKGTATAAPAPKVGMVEEGHEFLGGDPADPNSWKAVSQ